MLPVGFEPEPRVALIEPALIVLILVPEAGPLALSVGEALATTVSDMLDPQVLVAALLLASPP
jgi:hypothetical protein